MRIQRLIQVLAALVSFMVLSSAAAQTEVLKVRIIVAGATIHVKPDAQSRIIDKPAVGSLFETTKRVGEWYEIRLPSRLGMVITGYIQETAVEPENKEPESKKEALQEPLKVEPTKKEAVTPPEVTAPPKPWLGQISLGGLFALLQVGHEKEFGWPLYKDQLYLLDSLENGSAPGFELGLGVFPLRRLEVAASLFLASKSLAGRYGMGLPNIYRADDVAYAEDTKSARFQELILSLDVLFHPVKEGRIQPYLGGGVSYISGKIDLLQNITYRETYFSDNTHEIKLTAVDLSSKKANALGFQATVGLNFGLSETLAIFAEGRYLMAKKNLSLPLASELSGSDELVEINLGGARAGLGIKFRF